MNKPRTTLRERYPAPWLIEEMEESIRIHTKCGVTLARIYPCHEQNFACQSDPKPTWPEARTLARAIVGLSVQDGPKAHK